MYFSFVCIHEIICGKRVGVDASKKSKGYPQVDDILILKSGSQVKVTKVTTNHLYYRNAVGTDSIAIDDDYTVISPVRVADEFGRLGPVGFPYKTRNEHTELGSENSDKDVTKTNGSVENVVRASEPRLETEARADEKTGEDKASLNLQEEMTSVNKNRPRLPPRETVTDI